MKVSPFKHWATVHLDLRERILNLTEECEAHQKLGRRNSFQLAAADVFVEKAQVHLTERGTQFYIYGSLCAVLAVAVTAGAFALIYIFDPSALIKNLGEPTSTNYSWFVLVYFIKTAVLGGLSGGLIYFLAALSRAFFHEGTLIFARRHAIRFGRMYLYLKYGAPVEQRMEEFMTALSPTLPKLHIESIQTLLSNAGFPESVEVEDLEKAFGWNLETHTAFKDIKADRMSSNLFVKALDKIAEIAKSISEPAKEAVRRSSLRDAAD